MEFPGTDGLFQRIAPPVSLALRPFTTVFGTGTGGTTALHAPGNGGDYEVQRGHARKEEGRTSSGRERAQEPKALDREHDFAPALTRRPHVASSTGGLPAVLPASTVGGLLLG